MEERKCSFPFSFIGPTLSIACGKEHQIRRNTFWHNTKKRTYTRYVYTNLWLCSLHNFYIFRHPLICNVSFVLALLQFSKVFPPLALAFLALDLFHSSVDYFYQILVKYGRLKLHTCLPLMGSSFILIKQQVFRDTGYK